MWKALRLGLKTVTIIVLCGVLAPSAFAGVAFFTLVQADLPATLPRPKPATAQHAPSQVYDAEGNLIATFRSFETTGEFTKEEIPQITKYAVISSEDRNFYEHTGFDFRGTARALWADYRNRKLVQGGSTITQQYVKLTYTGDEKTVWRKVREAILASQVDRSLDKDEILHRYLKEVYFGDGAYGLGGAAQTFFHKPVSQLDISESALLAGLIPSPSRYAPRSNIDAAEDRRKTVLGLMHEQGYLTDDEFNRELLRTVVVAPEAPTDRPATHVFPAEGSFVVKAEYNYFIDWLREEIEPIFKEQLFQGGLQIYSTLDPRLQDLADQAAMSAVGKRKPVTMEMAIVTVEPLTGYIRAMHGGRDYFADGGQVNLTTRQKWAQPGSTWKVLDLVTALDKGVSPNRVFPAPASYTTRKNCKTTDKTCYIRNYGGSAYGSMTLEQATWKSVNTVYAALADEVGLNNIAKMAYKLGITTIDPNYSYKTNVGTQFALGNKEVLPLDMAAAYSVLAGRGQKATPSTIRYITSPTQAEPVLDNRNPKTEQVLDPVVADNANAILEGVLKPGGTASGAALNRPAAGKTGTTDGQVFAWFVGYTPLLSTAVAMGDRASPDNNPARQDGGKLPAQTWASYMRKATEGQPKVTFSEPDALKPIRDALEVRARGGINLGPQSSPTGLPGGGGCSPCDAELEAVVVEQATTPATAATTTSQFDPGAVPFGTVIDPVTGEAVEAVPNTTSP